MCGKSCFFVGHRDAPDDLYPRLKEIIRQHILQYHVSEFLVGQYGSFDRMATKAVVDLKRTHHQVTLTVLLPYHPGERRVEIPSGVDGTFYPPGMETVPRRYAIVRANRYAVDHADYLIAYACHHGSNAFELVEYAKRRGHNITLIGL